MLPQLDQIFQDFSDSSPTQKYVDSLASLGNPLHIDDSLPYAFSHFTDSVQKRGIAIAGAGLMGRSIAAAFLRKSIPVLLFDILEEALQTAPERIANELAYQLCDFEGEPRPQEREEAQRLVARYLTTNSSLADLDGREIILETIIEKTKVKQKFYKRLDAVCSAPKRLLSNTSTIKISELADGLKETQYLTPENFCGFHFFHPVRKRSLVEIIRGEKSSAKMIAWGEDLARIIDKSPITVGDGPGFLVNRLLNPYLEEGMTLLLEGIDPDRIESITRRFGMEMGPFRIMDEIGLDVTFHSGWSFYKAFPEYIRSSELLPTLIESGRLGRKNGRGFKLYDSAGSWEGEGRRDDSLWTLIAPLREAAKRPIIMGTAPDGRPIPLNGPDISDEVILLRILCAILFEAVRIRDAGIIDRLEEADRALLFGLGFPHRRGGIVYWADRFGLAALNACGEELAPLNSKYSPPPAFQVRAAANKTLLP